MKRNTQGNLILLLTAMIWGMAFVVQSLGMEHLEPISFNGIRTAVGGIALIPVILIIQRNKNPEEKKISRDTVWGGIACGGCLFLASTIQQIGLSTTTAGKAAFITALYVLIVPVMGIFIGKKISKIIWVCVPVALAGFYLLCVKEGLSVSKGDLLCLLSSFFFSLHIMTIDYFTEKKTDAIMMSCIQFFTAGLLSVIPAAIFESPDLKSVFEVKWNILYTGVISAGVGYTLQIIGQKRTEPAPATLILSMESVFAALSGWIVLGQKLSIREFLGCLLVFSAVVLAQFPEVFSRIFAEYKNRKTGKNA